MAKVRWRRAAREKRRHIIGEVCCSIAISVDEDARGPRSLSLAFL